MLLVHREAVKSRSMVSIGRWLGTPLQTGKIWIFAVLAGASLKLFGFALKAALFLLALFHVACFFALPFCECCLACSSHDVLLGLRQMNV